MARSKLIAAAVAAMITFSTATPSAGGMAQVRHGGGSSAFVAWTVIVCAGLIVTAAFIANRRENRPLTAGEATTCGLAFWLKPPPR